MALLSPLSRLLQGIAPNGKLYWLRQPTMGGWIYGPYVNHNHYAGLMELLVPIPLVLSLTRLAEERERIAAGIAAAIMVGTIFLSGSRGGMIAIFVELVVFRSRRASPTKNRSDRNQLGFLRDRAGQFADLAGRQRTDFPCFQHLHRSPQGGFWRNAPVH